MKTATKTIDIQTNIKNDAGRIGGYKVVPLAELSLVD